MFNDVVLKGGEWKRSTEKYPHFYDLLKCYDDEILDIHFLHFRTQ